MQVDEFSKRRADLHLLDVREDDEWAAGHIDGAQHIPLGELLARLSELPKERTIVAVCRSGGRSEAAVRGLRKLGFEAENLEGGVNAWDRAKLPLPERLVPLYLHLLAGQAKSESAALIEARQWLAGTPASSPLIA